MRGQRTFEKITQTAGLADNQRIGRSNALVARRNECLLVRCYYWSTEKNKCYEEVIRLLVDEFFISPVTVARLMQRHAKRLAGLRQSPPTSYYLQLRWPHFRW